MEFSSAHLKTMVFATTIGVISVLGLHWYNKKRKNAVPTNWEAVGSVKKIFLYPLKSGRRLELEKAECTSFGLQQIESGNFKLRDRCLVVYKAADKEFRTARTHPKMVLIKVTTRKPNYFVFNAPDMPELQIEAPDLKNTNQGTFIEMFSNEKVFTIDCGDEVARWLSRYITGNDSGLRVGYHDGSFRRNVSRIYKEYFKIHKNFSNLFLGMYSDLASYMVMNQSSVNELLTRLPNSKVTVNNFRPSILVDGTDLGPYAEDGWDFIKIGDKVVMRAFKPCTRCIFTTIDPETGIRSPNSEPLKTLKSYRLLKDLRGIELEGDSPVMGVNFGLISNGEINVGDTVYVGKN